MEDFSAMIKFSVWLAQYEMILWGFTFSFWDFLIWSIVAGIVILLIRGFFGG